MREREARPDAPAELARSGGRSPRQARPLKIERGVLPQAEGSVLIAMGRTRVMCTASVEDRLPNWLRGKGRGWVTAEYGMLPRATSERTPRSVQAGGRAQEIQRLIGRSLRAVTDLTVFGERTITLDCDVIEADGGTRTAAVNGALIALHDAFVTLSNRGALAGPPLRDTVAAISVGLVGRVPCLDLDYAEDSRAEVDMNVVMTGGGRFVELQGTGESASFSAGELRAMLALARAGIRRLLRVQRRLLGDSGLLPGE
ncbi:MAG: ribonuclease PH [Candidatus Eisenbacteria bacterium RBG_19FT_COMBO_70_11]|nr:MAG: ribonuclease PH [Candidatus Eisenbacteria bacterium RBG_19FT_COMBO_70_11]